MNEDPTEILYLLLFFAIFVGIPVISIALLLWDPKKTSKKLDAICEKWDREASEKGSYKDTKAGRFILHPVFSVFYYLFLTVVVLIGAFVFTIMPLGGATIIGLAIGFFSILKKARTSMKHDIHPSWLEDSQQSINDVRQTLSKIIGRGFDDNSGG